jgi:hypothetical protein
VISPSGRVNNNRAQADHDQHRTAHEDDAADLTSPAHSGRSHQLAASAAA